MPSVGRWRYLPIRVCQELPEKLEPAASLPGHAPWAILLIYIYTYIPNNASRQDPQRPAQWNSGVMKLGATAERAGLGIVLGLSCPTPC